MSWQIHCIKTEAKSVAIACLHILHNVGYFFFLCGNCVTMQPMGGLL